ncbi:MAG TPA: PPOX class F420-dependent oxidoreductase, partial [Candidatus Avipropionibacterium avicola]|nr:PPOX class F420-dependent oxidoreductase [Candidatus Avipropionibacterium avicola]
PDGELIQRLAHKYTGAAYDGADPTKGRVVVRVKPHKVFWR